MIVCFRVVAEIALWDFDTFNPDDKVGDSVLFELNELPDNDTVLKTFTFGKVSCCLITSCCYADSTFLAGKTIWICLSAPFAGRLNNISRKHKLVLCFPS